MLFSPPTIKHIDDVLPHIKGKNEIIHMVKEDYQVLDYVYVLADTFDNPYAKECRGLKFDRDGNLIARPYHKFHNLGENTEYSTTRVDLSLPHVRLDKLDGSMIHNVQIGDNWFLMTRKGHTEVAKEAELADCVRDGKYYSMFGCYPQFTFIFEYVGPNNKIVIDYDEENLILTGMRRISDGFYLPYWQMCTIARKYNIPYVGIYEGTDVKNDNEKEGCIIRFDTGAMVKMKSEIYVRKHRSKDLVCNFKDLVKLIIEDNLDDVLPQLDEETKTKIVEYRDNFLMEISVLEGYLISTVEAGKEKEQKDFAFWIAGLSQNKKSLLFNTRKSGNANGEIYRCIQRAYSDTQRLTALFEELALPIWKFDFFTSEI